MDAAALHLAAASASAGGSVSKAEAAGERWQWHAAALTAALGVAAYSLMPYTRMSNDPWFLPVFTMWLTFFAAVPAGVWAARAAIRTARGGRRRRWAELDHRSLLLLLTGYCLIAANLTLFGMLKPQLAYVVPFTADPWLADLDRWLLGADAWTRLAWFYHPALSALYHKGWFIWLAVILYVAMQRPRSGEKQRLLVSYFMIWSLFGPLVHLLAPAAGPIFYDDLGLGSRFAGLPADAETRVLIAYLLDGWRLREFNPGGGISAMPSIHLATMAWTMLALRGTRWFALAAVFTVYILLGSVVLGWHYAVDGLAGLAGGWICYVAAGALFRSGRRPAPASAPFPST